MAINFDALPKEKPANTGGFELPEPGIHKAVIESTAVKPGNAGPYLEVVLKLEQGSKVWDRIIPSDKPAMQYKLSRFLRACRIPLTGEMELADLGRVVTGKTVYVDIKHQENTYQGNTTMRAEVEIFKGDVYYTPEDMDTPFAETPQAPAPTNTSGSY